MVYVRTLSADCSENLSFVFVRRYVFCMMWRIHRNSSLSFLIWTKGSKPVCRAHSSCLLLISGLFGCCNLCSLSLGIIWSCGIGFNNFFVDNLRLWLFLTIRLFIVSLLLAVVVETFLTTATSTLSLSALSWLLRLFWLLIDCHFLRCFSSCLLSIILTLLIFTFPMWFLLLKVVGTVNLIVLFFVEFLAILVLPLLARFVVYLRLGLSIRCLFGLISNCAVWSISGFGALRKRFSVFCDVLIRLYLWLSPCKRLRSTRKLNTSLLRYCLNVLYLVIISSFVILTTFVTMILSLRPFIFQFVLFLLYCLIL